MRQETLFDVPEDSTCPVCGHDLEERPEPRRVVICSGCGRGITEDPKLHKLRTALAVDDAGRLGVR